MAQYHATVDLRHAESARELHVAFKDALKLPDFYGMNWSAWIDCLSDWDMIGIEVPANSALLILVKGTERFKRADEGAYKLLLTCLRDVNVRFEKCGSPCRVQLDLE